MAKESVEDIKRASRHLRGEIADVLGSDASHFDEAEKQLLKFHGTYQQDDRDVRKERKRAGEEARYIFMVRSRIPGGRMTAEQYLMHERCAEAFGNGTIRITSRQGFQLHHVVKGNLKETIRRISESGLSTWNACGDVCRNHMATPIPLATAAHRDVQRLSDDLVETFGARSRAYAEIWLNGERINDAPEEEPIYGETYLPRKFKFAAAVPPRNDVDILSNDVGLAVHAPDDEVEGYTIYVGGGMGMTHAKEETWPALAQPFAYVRRSDLIEVLRAIVTTQRDFGNRENRRRARLKYTIADMGFQRFTEEVKSRATGATFEPPRDVQWETVGDMLGWHEQGDGKVFVCVYVPDGRISDCPDGPQYRSAFRTIAETIGCPVRNTANTNILFHDLEPAQRSAVDEILAKHRVPLGTDLTAAMQTSQACVALPTCGLALAESERVFPDVMGDISEVLLDLGLEQEPLLIRMTGCPNGCARPFNADIGLVGRSPDKYAVYVGGSHRGDRLAGLYRKTVPIGEIRTLVRGLLEEFKAGRADGEPFTDWWARTQVNGDAPSSEQFHVELKERRERMDEGGGAHAE